jgi:hypothetical protein
MRPEQVPHPAEIAPASQTKVDKKALNFKATWHDLAFDSRQGPASRPSQHDMQ